MASGVDAGDYSKAGTGRVVETPRVVPGPTFRATFKAPFLWQPFAGAQGAPKSSLREHFGAANGVRTRDPQIHNLVL